MQEQNPAIHKFFQHLPQKAIHLPLPEHFTFPFYYEPNQLAVLAVEELQHKLENFGPSHNFGLNPNHSGPVIGKMFGVLVVKNQQGNLGYLQAFSGKLAGENNHSGFVPPVFDMLTTESFFLQEERELNKLNDSISKLENSDELKVAKREYSDFKSKTEHELHLLKTLIKANKILRKIQRDNAVGSDSEIQTLLENLRKESIKEQYHLKEFSKQSKKKLLELQEKLSAFEQKIEELKSQRRDRSAELQNKLFDQYRFLNYNKESKSLLEIFKNTTEKKPPAGAGECAAPKLLHFAFKHDLQPIALAEFWWGASPKSEVRIHKNYYPACRGKCEPILGHMLTGLKTDPNPLLQNPAENKALEIIYEDEYLLAVNKPHEFLSVPGKNITDSVQTRMQQKFPLAEGSLLIHRLDMSTSGILLIAKNKEIHKALQRQFIKRLVKKRYIALLDGLLKEKQGVIDLPLRVDLDDRPRQLVCFEHGKQAVTRWEVVKQIGDKTLVYFYPETGRTHQLRVHAAHPLGLNSPIIGDDIYGKRSHRLHLHANLLEFMHPKTKEIISLILPVNFDE